MNEKYTFITEEASKQNRTILKSEDRYNHKYINPEFRPNSVHFLIRRESNSFFSKKEQVEKKRIQNAVTFAK